MKKKVANYIADFLVAHGIEHNFTVTGGGAMHLNDALGHKEGLTCIYNHHEQACAMAAEAYARIAGKVACVCVTSGPGGTNAITGAVGGWLDSIPMFILSGQVKRELTCASYPELGLRQLGDQELDIISIVKNFTKYSVMVTKPEEIAYHLEKAFYLCQDGKGGPVWLDIPLDVQGAMIETEELRHFDAVAEDMVKEYAFDAKQAQKLMQMIQKAKAPLLLAGSAIRYSHSEKQFLELVDKLQIPVVTAWAANDILPGNHSCFVGVPGTLGTRAGNFAVQQCDLLISLGCRMNVRMVGYNRGDFARNAYKVMVDIEQAELCKPTYVPDWGICADVHSVITELFQVTYQPNEAHPIWLSWCQELKRTYSVVLDSYHTENGPINPYVFTELLFQQMEEADIMVCSNGSACVMPIQVSDLKTGQRLICNSGCAAMGYGLPAAVGAAMAEREKRIICMEGDGSIMMNLQELATAKGYGLNIKIIIINNQGYHSIRQTQTNNFKGMFVGVDGMSGVAIPSYTKIAEAFEIPYISIMEEKEAKVKLEQVWQTEGIVICEAFVDIRQNFAPKSAAKVMEDGSIVSPSIDDMAPFLEKDEYEAVQERRRLLL